MKKQVRGARLERVTMKNTQQRIWTFEPTETTRKLIDLIQEASQRKRSTLINEIIESFGSQYAFGLIDSQKEAMKLLEHNLKLTTQDSASPIDHPKKKRRTPKK